MKEGWKKVLLADYYTISSGLSKSADQFGYGYPFVSFKDVFRNYFLPKTLTQLVNTNDRERNTCSVKKGDVFLTRTSETVEELGMSSVALQDYENATFNGFTKRLRPKNDDDIDPQYIGFYLRSAYFRGEVTAYSILTTRASLNNEIIGKLKINLPPLPTQQKIGSILSAYDDLIENNNKRIALLEQMASELYKEWFVRLRFPNYKNTPIVDGVPEGWEKVKIEDIFNTSSGSTPSRKVESYYDGNINWVKTKELLDTFIFQTEEKITAEGLKKSSAKIFPVNTVLMGMYGGVHGEGRKSTLGQLGILTEPSTTNQACCAFLPKEDYKNIYLYLFLYLKQIRPNLLNMSMGAAQQNISQQIIRGVEFILPSEKTSSKFNELIMPIFKEIEILSKKNNLLQQTRDLLLPRLISGKLQV